MTLALGPIEEAVEVPQQLVVQPPPFSATVTVEKVQGRQTALAHVFLALRPQGPETKQVEFAVAQIVAPSAHQRAQFQLNPLVFLYDFAPQPEDPLCFGHRRLKRELQSQLLETTSRT